MYLCRLPPFSKVDISTNHQTRRGQTQNLYSSQLHYQINVNIAICSICFSKWYCVGVGAVIMGYISFVSVATQLFCIFVPAGEGPNSIE